jgi:hypothetical protein
MAEQPKLDLEKLPLLDSFIKESVRYNYTDASESLVSHSPIFEPVLRKYSKLSAQGPRRLRLPRWLKT